MHRIPQFPAIPCFTENPLVILTALAIRAILIVVSISLPACGQMTITNPAGVDQSTLRTNGRVIAASSTQGIQVHVRTIKLLVDQETRAAIYQNVGSPGFSVQTSIDPPPPTIDLAAVSEAIQESVTVRSPTTCAMAVIDRSVSDQILSLVSQANPTSVKRSPAVMLINGKVGEMNDIIERPFAIGFDSQNLSATVEKFEEGMKIRMLAMPSTSSIRFTAEIISSRITSVVKMELPQESRDPVAVDVPVQQTQSVVVSASLAPNQCLLVDPHVTKVVTATEESPTPMFGKIPYIGKNFSNSTSVQVDRHILVLLMPSAVGQ